MVIFLYLLQLAGIILLAKLFGFLISRIGQPPVIGEMLTGLVLGPLMLAGWFPGIPNLLFPGDSEKVLETFSQTGLLVFMFILGFEVDHHVIKTHGRQITWISIVNIGFSFLTGAILGYLLFSGEDPYKRGVITFFTGLVCSITSLPVIARIIKEKNLMRTSYGPVALTVAAVNDLITWLLLAGILFYIQADEINNTFLLVLGTVVYLFIMFYSMPRIFRYFYKVPVLRAHNYLGYILLVIIFFILSCWIADYLNIHALIGAFLAGFILPRDETVLHIWSKKGERIVSFFFLPVFFVLSGMKIDFEGNFVVIDWYLLGIVIAVSFLGKIGGTYIPARITGMLPVHALHLPCC